MSKLFSCYDLSGVVKGDKHSPLRTQKCHHQLSLSLHGNVHACIKKKNQDGSCDHGHLNFFDTFSGHVSIVLWQRSWRLNTVVCLSLIYGKNRYSLGQCVSTLATYIFYRVLFLSILSHFNTNSFAFNTAHSWLKLMGFDFSWFFILWSLSPNFFVLTVVHIFNTLNSTMP